MPSQMVATAALRPNRFNYNTQSPAVFQKVVESLRIYGFTEPVVVRALKGGTFEIINGEHRWRAATSLGMPEVPIYNLGVIDDKTAKQLCITLNELGGTSDELRLAQLMRDIVGDGAAPDSLYNEEAVERLEKAMPYSDNAIRQMVESVDFSFTKLTKKDTREARKPGKEQPPVEAPPEPSTPKRGQIPVVVSKARLSAINADLSAAVLWLLDWHAAQGGEKGNTR